MLASFPGDAGGSFCHRLVLLEAVEKGLGVTRLYSLQGQGVVVLAGLAVPDEVAALLAESQQVLGLSSADGSMIPSGEKGEGQNLRTGPHS